MNLIGNISGSPSNTRVTGMLGHRDRVKFAHRMGQGASSFDFTASVAEYNPGLNYNYYFFFAKQGEKLYIGTSGDYLQSYTCSTPYDVSTATSDNKQLDHRDIDSGVYSGTMDPSGRYLYLGGYDEDTVNTLTMTTPYDITTAKSGVDAKVLTLFHDIGSVGDYQRYGFRFNNDGTKFYAVGYNQDRVEQFSLSTAYDITTYSSDGHLSLSSFSIPSCTNIIWNNNGTKFYTVGASNDDVNEFSVSTAYDVTSTVTELNEFFVGSQESSPEDIAFSSDGTKMFICGTSGDDINVYDLTTGFDTSTASFDTNYNVGSTGVRTMCFSPDGTKLMVGDTNSDVIYYYTLSTAFDLSTLSTASTIDLSPPEMRVLAGSLNNIAIAELRSIRFNDDGTYLYVVDAHSSYDKVIQVRLMEPYNPTKAALGYIDADHVGVSAPNSFEFNNDGTRVFILDGSDDVVYSWDLDYPYILGPNIVTYLGASVTLSSQEASPTGMAFAPDGSGFYMTGYSSDKINYYSCANPYDISDITFVSSRSINSYDSTPREVVITFSHSELQLHLGGNGAGKIHTFNMLM